MSRTEAPQRFILGDSKWREPNHAYQVPNSQKPNAFVVLYFIMSALLQPSKEAPVSQVMSEVIARTKIEKILQRKPWKEEEEEKKAISRLP